MVIHCGTNDIYRNEKNIRSLFEELVDDIRVWNSNICVIINSILPRPADFEVTNPVILNVNRVLDLWSKRQEGVHFNPVYRSFLRNRQIRSDQSLYEKNDYWHIHLSEEGVARVVRNVKQQIHLFRKGFILKID